MKRTLSHPGQQLQGIHSFHFEHLEDRMLRFRENIKKQRSKVSKRTSLEKTYNTRTYIPFRIRYTWVSLGIPHFMLYSRQSYNITMITPCQLSVLFLKISMDTNHTKFCIENIISGEKYRTADTHKQVLVPHKNDWV